MMLSLDERYRRTVEGRRGLYIDGRGRADKGIQERWKNGRRTL